MPKFKLFTDYIFRFVQRLFFIRDKRRQPNQNLAIERTFVPLKRRSKVLSEVWYVILGYSDIIKSTALHRTGLEMIQGTRGWERGRACASSRGRDGERSVNIPPPRATAVTEHRSPAANTAHVLPSLTESSFAVLFSQWRAHLVRIMADGRIFCLEN